MNNDLVRRVVDAFAYGDSLGLPVENLNASQIAKSVLRPSSMVSDDTEHLILTLIASNSQDSDFTENVRIGLRRWFLAFPPSLGFATFRSCFLLLFRKNSFGVRSQGNGCLPRAVAVGLCAKNRSDLSVHSELSCRLTHNDDFAVDCSQILAACIYFYSRGQEVPWDTYFSNVHADLFANVIKSSPEAFLASIELSEPTGHAPITLAVALACESMHPGDVDASVRHAISLGGDTDSVAAIAGALAAAHGGSAPVGWDSHMSDSFWNSVSKDDVNELQWPSWSLMFKRNIKQLVLAVSLSCGPRLRARTS